MESQNPKPDIGQEIISKLKELNEQLDELILALTDEKES
jgi:hypothetical protein